MESKHVYFTIFLIFIIRLSLLFFIKEMISFEEIAHYIIARNAFNNPIEFLCPYAKPGYTLLLSLFIYLTMDIFGLYIMRFFTVLVSLLASFYCYKTLTKLNFSEKEAIFGVIIFHLGHFNALYHQSGLTEPFAVLLIIMGYYYFKCQKYLLSSFIFSYSYLVRNETIFIIAVLGFYYFFCLKKNGPIIIFSVFPVVWLLLMILLNIDWTIMFTYNSETLATLFIAGYRPEYYQNIIVIFYYIHIFIEFYGVLYLVLMLFGFYFIIKHRWNELFIYFLLSYFVLLFVLLFNYMLFLENAIRLMIPINSFTYIIVVYGIKEIIKVIYHEVNKLKYSKRNGFRLRMHNMSFSKITSYIWGFLLIALSISSTLFIRNWVSLECSPQYKDQFEVVSFLKNNYDLDKIRLFCPDGFPIILLAHKTPIVYYYPFGEDNYPNSSSTVVIPIKGFFYREYSKQNLVEYLNKGDLIIWTYEKAYENSTFNPIYVNQQHFKKIYLVENSIKIIIYEKQ